ncbi:uncharacterized protein TNCV_4851741 [Trichonephila clavipes]|nr:uncharacterized protein TNCV_4851741 [Trichonephila clavipes]
MLPDLRGHLKWSVPIHMTGWKFLNCVIPFRYEVTEEETPLYVTLYRNKKLYLKEVNHGYECLFQRMRDKMCVLSRKQQNMIKEIKKIKQEWAMDQKCTNTCFTFTTNSSSSPSHEPSQDVIYDSLPHMGQSTVPESPLKDLLPVDSKTPVVFRPPEVSTLPPVKKVAVKKVDSVIHREHSPRSREVAAVAEWYRYRIVACLVTSSIPVPLKTRRVGQRCTLNLSRAETSSRWCGVVVRRGGASSGVVHVT